MFTASVIHPQLVVPLSHLSAVWNTVRSSAHNISLGRHYRTSHNITVTASTEVPASTNEVTESLHTVLNDLGLNELSGDVKVEALAPAVCSNVKHPASHWNQSNTLSDSFFKNKHGVTETQLEESNFGEKLSQTFKITMPNLSNMSGLNRVNNPVYQQVRGFKTKHSGTSGLGPYKVNREDSFPAIKNLRESVLGRISPSAQSKSTAKESDKLQTLMSNYDHAPETQDKLKLAFAEGYAANSKRESSQENLSWGRRIAKYAWYGILVYLLVQLFQGYSALGGNMKINVLKGERYEVNPEEITITFDDVRGADEAKQELQDIVNFLQDPEKFKALGAKLPKGVLLVGSPGIGKTLLARAVAGEAGVPFFHASGSEFDEIFVGTGAKRVRQLFDAAKARAPCVIFIDEIDTVGAKRTSSQIHPYANQTINQLLSEMDGFQQNEGVIVLGATNRRDNLDKALLRPGRFDVEVRVFAPDLKGRKEILELYLTKVKVGPDVDIDSLARGTTGCTGADLENMVNQAALKAAMDGAPVVTHLHMEFAKDKVLMGPAKKTRITDEETNLCTAYHEAGHTLVAFFTKGAIPLHKVTIIPRGMSLGHTSFIPEKEQYNYTRQQLLAQMDVAMGGRVAEELVFGKDQITTGASSDFSTATNIATAMVKKYGMSEKVGVRVFSDDELDGGTSFVRVNDVSPATAEVVDSEIKRLLNESYERATKILEKHTKAHKALSQYLMKYETLDADDIKAIIEGKKPIKVENTNTASDKRVSKGLTPNTTEPSEGIKQPL